MRGSTEVSDHHPLLCRVSFKRSLLSICVCPKDFQSVCDPVVPTDAYSVSEPSLGLPPQHVHLSYHLATWRLRQTWTEGNSGRNHVPPHPRWTPVIVTLASPLWCVHCPRASRTRSFRPGTLASTGSGTLARRAAWRWCGIDGSLCSTGWS